ncbi:PTS-dependent dihydroxyacetone kinase, ADP-binding subunit DhaL [Fervidicola ferrireducens]|uniref:phosphoenolpyruvate--glycerone phosphotransferase n=1 Tax=Fervidicola ferrireducens TaxID=520764 RepID=A0A140L8T9_9FIRM|nr:dihydroxyacetone kinase subunit DhaL [Fervidicola ferrireducens]KXG76964.1 PTS-dependent dihydroxyacetone kinase, ADP-binding subunit DhaL [Fervidicola ferrireducens]
MAVDSAKLVEIIKAISEKITENKEYLTQLDSAIGDADHGINMSKGFRAVVEKISGMEGKDCGTILKTVGMTLISTVGGASGPLYGTAFMKAGQAVTGKSHLDFNDLITLMEAALEGIKYRGKAEKGEKTIVDALEPAVEALKRHREEGVEVALREAVEEAKKGMEYTKDIIAKKGRASYLGERSLGHQDPGATSCYIMLETMAAQLLDGKKS